MGWKAVISRREFQVVQKVSCGTDVTSKTPLKLNTVQ